MKQQARVEKILKWSQKYTKTDMEYVARGGFWLVLNNIGLFIFSLITMLAFGRWLNQEAFGTYQYVLAGTMLAGIFALPGIKTAVIKSIARGKEGTLALATKEKMKWAVLGSFGLFAAAGWYFVNDNMVLAGAFAIAGLFMPMEKSFTMFFSFWSGKKRFDKKAKYNLYSTFLSLLILIPAIYLTDNVVLIVLAYFVSHVLFEGLFYLKTLKQVKNKEVDKEAVPFGKNLTIIGAVQTIARHIDKVIVWHFLGPVQVAVYSFAQIPMERIKGALPIQPLALPKLGEKEIDEKRKRGVISKFVRLFVIFIPLAAAFALAAPLAYRILFPQYMESVAYFQVLSVLIALAPFMLLNTALVAETRKKELYIVQTTAPALKILLFLALIPFYGIWGMVAAILIAEILQGLMTLYYFQRI